MPTQLHALIASLFNAMLFLYVQKNPIGWVFSELRIKLADDDLNDRLPDVALVLKEGRTFEPDAPLTYIPDLVVEIQSPGQSDKFMLDQATFFLKNGGKVVWSVYPAKRLVEVLTLTDRQLLTEADTLEGGDLMPGFMLPVKEIYLLINYLVERPVTTISYNVSLMSSVCCYKIPISVSRSLILVWIRLPVLTLFTCFDLKLCQCSIVRVCADQR